VGGPAHVLFFPQKMVTMAAKSLGKEMDVEGEALK